jgi:4-amino-4-deoxy-L-arabinose transferase-like glycosyltransferase
VVDADADADAGSRPDAFARLLPTIALLALVVRVAYTVGWRFDGLKYDGPVYRNRAQFLLVGRSFLDPDQWGFHKTAAQGAIHPPGNALFLALGNQIGFDTDHRYQLWGCLLGTATVVVVAFLGREVAGPRVGLIAATLAAVHPGLWSFDPTVMAESPGQFCTALTLLLAYRFWRDQTPARAAWMAAAAAAAALVRSELLVLLPMLVLPLVLASRGTTRQILARLGAAAIWSVAVLGPWVGWNVVRFEHPVTLASGLDLSLAYAQCDDTWYGEHTGYWNVFCGAEIPKEPANRFADESQLGAQYRSEASHYITHHLSRWPVVIAARMGRTLSVYRPAQQVRMEASREGRESGVLWAGVVATYACGTLALVAFRRPPRSVRHLLPLLVPLAAGVAGAAITFGTTRYRSAGEVGLLVLAAVGIDAILRIRSATARSAPPIEAEDPPPSGELTPPTPAGHR